MCNKEILEMVTLIIITADKIKSRQTLALHSFEMSTFPQYSWTVKEETCADITESLYEDCVEIVDRFRKNFKQIDERILIQTLLKSISAQNQVEGYDSQNEVDPSNIQVDPKKTGVDT